LGKDVLIHNKNQRVAGLCGHKKGFDWKENVLQDYKEEQLVDLSKGEYKTITVLTTVDAITNCGICKAKHLLTKVLALNNHPLVKHIIVSTHQKDTKNFNVIADFLETSCNIPWTLDSLLEEPIGLKEQLDHSARLVKTYWTATLDTKKRLGRYTLDNVEKILDDVTQNPVGFYFEESNSVNLIYPTYSFEKMDGNNEMWWFDKVKTFDNWKDVCHQII
jgi:hypothetical protein